MLIRKKCSQNFSAPSGAKCRMGRKSSRPIYLVGKTAIFLFPSSQNPSSARPAAKRNRRLFRKHRLLLSAARFSLFSVPRFPDGSQNIFEHQKRIQLIIPVASLQIVEQMPQFRCVRLRLHLIAIDGKNRIFFALYLRPVDLFGDFVVRSVYGILNCPNFRIKIDKLIQREMIEAG